MERFTLVGATTRFGQLTPPMRARFGIVERLSFYPADELTQIVNRSAGILKVPIAPEGAVEIARRSRGTPRIANRLLRRVRDYAQVKADGVITAQVAAEALARLNVDEFGLDDMDKRILTTIIEKFGGGPVGLGTIAAAVGEDAGTLEEVYEPYLLQQGFLERTQRGRVATANAYKRFGITPPPATGGQARCSMADARGALRTSDFDYELPSELIAQTPSAVRGGSRLLVVRREDARTQGARDSFEDRRFSDLLELIPPGDLLVLNSTRVRHARLLGRRSSGAPAEVLLLHPGGE